MKGGHAAGGADRADAVFQRGETLFKHRNGRIGDARIDVARALQIEQRRGMIGVLKDVGRRLIDRNGAGAGDGSGCWPACRLSVSNAGGLGAAI
jgi:hypothetical protein